MNELGPESPLKLSAHGVVVTVAPTSDRRRPTGFGQPFGVATAWVLTLVRSASQSQFGG